MITLEFENFEEAQQYFAELDIAGQLEQVISIAGEGLRSGAANVTPVETGAMQRAWEFVSSELEGELRIDPTATNPRSGVPVADYAEFVDDRVGITDAVVADWPRIGAAALDQITLEEG